MLLGSITCFGPALVISVVYGCMPPVSASMLAKADIEKALKYDSRNEKYNEEYNRFYKNIS